MQPGCIVLQQIIIILDIFAKSLVWVLSFVLKRIIGDRKETQVYSLCTTISFTLDRYKTKFILSVFQSYLIHKMSSLK